MSAAGPAEKPIAVVLAQQFMRRAEAIGLKGYSRDKLALEFFLGAGTALQLAGHPSAGSVQATTSNIIANAGYMGVRRLAGDA